MNVCADKHRYATGAKARTAAETIRRRGEKRDKKPARAYHCEHCNGWHLTAMRQKPT